MACLANGTKTKEENLKDSSATEKRKANTSGGTLPDRGSKQQLTKMVWRKARFKTGTSRGNCVWRATTLEAKRMDYLRNGMAAASKSRRSYSRTIWKMAKAGFGPKKGILVGIQDFAAGRLTKDINYRSGAINTGGAYKQVFNEKQSFFTVDITGETVIPRNSVDITYSVDGQLLQLFNYSLDNYLDGTTEPKNERETLELFVEKEQAYINRMTDFEIKVEKEWGQTASGSQYLHWHFVSPSSVAKDQKPRTVQREHYITIVCNRQILNLYSVVTNSDDPAAIPEMLKRIAESTQIKSDRIDLNKLIKKI